MSMDHGRGLSDIGFMKKRGEDALHTQPSGDDDDDDEDEDEDEHTRSS